MESEHKEKLRTLKKGIEQLNKRLFVNNLILSIGIASILTLAIDYFWDLRLIIFVIWLVIITYLAYKLLFESKFSIIRKRFDITQNDDEEYENEIREGYISLKLGQHNVTLNFKDCVYVLTDDFVFAFQTFKLLGIFIIDKSKPKKELFDFLSKFKKQRNLRPTSAFAILIVFISFALKISMITINQNFFKDDYTYKVKKINIADSVLYDTSNSEFIILTTNFLSDCSPETNVVKFHCRKEYNCGVRIIYNVFENPSKKVEQIFTKKFLGYYSYQIKGNEIKLQKPVKLTTPNRSKLTRLSG